MKQLTALVLAGTRASGDPLAAYAGVSHKALIEVGGRTMIERVVSALAAVPEVARIVVAIERPELLTDLPELQPNVCTKPLTTSWLSEFLAACPEHADVCVALGRSDVVQAAAPNTKRTWLRFANGHFSGCNLFLMARPAAAGAAELWCELERHRKDPLQLMRRLGWSVALRYRMGQLTLAAAIGRLGVLAGGARLAIVEMSDGRAAIDVDKPEDLDLVREMVGR